MSDISSQLTTIWGLNTCIQMHTIPRVMGFLSIYMLRWRLCWQGFLDWVRQLFLLLGKHQIGLLALNWFMAITYWMIGRMINGGS